MVRFRAFIFLNDNQDGLPVLDLGPSRSLAAANLSLARDKQVWLVSRRGVSADVR
jgi:hypothetical protein